MDKVFEVKRQHCTCHPETCGHFPYIIELNGKVIGSYTSKDKAEDVVKILSKADNKRE